MKTIQGFTLIEILIVLAIIGILMAVLVPALQNSRRKAVETSAYAYARQCTTSLTKLLLDNPEAPVAGMTCQDASIEMQAAPSYVTATQVVDAASGAYLSYTYKVNTVPVTASIPVNIR